MIRSRSRRQYVAPLDTLNEFGARPIYHNALTDDGYNDDNNNRMICNNINNSSSSSSSNRDKRCSSGSSGGGGRGENDDDDELLVQGISIGGWDITTQTSCIGNHEEMEQLTEYLESHAQRRLCAPECVYTNAYVSLRRSKKEEVDSIIGTTGRNRSSTEPFAIRLTARDALVEWASAHVTLDSHNEASSRSLKDDEMESNDYGGGDGGGGSGLKQQQQQQQRRPLSHTNNSGVSILKSIDAQLWSKRKQCSGKPQQHEWGDDRVVHASDLFRYDWTFSTPYAATVVAAKPCSSSTSEIVLTTATTTTTAKAAAFDDSAVPPPPRPSPQVLWWQPCQSSGLNMELLSNQSIPILYYDEVVLYEDDMHDNGDVSLDCKLRVMPHCWYLLMRLFVRVDHVLVRVRDTRLYCEFSSSPSTTTTSTTTNDDDDDREKDNNNNNASAPPVVKVYRDVCWRECKWQDLQSRYQLPNHPKMWRTSTGLESSSSSSSGDGSDATYNLTAQQQQQQLQSLIARLPMVMALPDHLSSHSLLQIIQ